MSRLPSHHCFSSSAPIREQVLVTDPFRTHVQLLICGARDRPVHFTRCRRRRRPRARGAFPFHGRRATVRPRSSALGLLICRLLLLLISTANLNFTTVIRSLNTYVYSTLLEMQSRWTKIQLGKV
jgi:hypothetical protein